MRSLPVFGAVIALVVALGAASPAQAADPPGPAVEAVVPDTTIAPGASVNEHVYLVNPTGWHTYVRNAVVSINTTGLDGATARLDDGIGCPGHPKQEICRVRDGHYERTWWVLHFTLQAKSEAQPGRTGTVTLRLTADGMPPTTHTTRVTIGTGADLTDTVAPSPVTGSAGDRITLPTGVRNSGPVPINGVALLLTGFYGFTQDRRYRNCRYDETAMNMYCVFDTTLLPGVEYTVNEPLTTTIAADTPSSNTVDSSRTGVFASFRWHLPADANRTLPWMDISAYQPGQEPPLSLVAKTPDAAARSAGPGTVPTFPQTDVHPDDNSHYVDLTVGGDRIWNLVGTGTTVSGAAGATVSARVGVTNAGPVTMPGGRVTRVTIPTGTTAVSVPTTCFGEIANTEEWQNQATPGAARYRCVLSGALRPGESRSWDFGLRIDQRIDDATGSVEADRELYGDSDYIHDGDDTDDRAAIVVNPTRPDAWTGGAGLTSNPTVSRHPLYSVPTVLADAGGNLVVKRQSGSDNHWESWQKMRADLTGTPVPVVNPDTRDLEIYANAGGHLVQKHWDTADLNWSSGWVDLGGDITGDPVALYNPNNGNIEVYANSGGHIVERYRKATSTTWSGWGTLGGDVDGRPMALYNENNHNIEVYANSHGNLVEKYWNAGNGRWSGWNAFGGDLTSSPVAFNNTSNHNIEIYANSHGNLVEKYWNAGNGRWSDWNTFGGQLSGEPSVLFNEANRNVEIYGNSGGRLVEKYWVAGTGRWSDWNNLDGRLGGAPVAFQDAGQGAVRIFGVTDRRLVERHWTPGNGQWSDWATP
jgi:hypothetical protein